MNITTKHFETGVHLIPEILLYWYS